MNQRTLAAMVLHEQRAPSSPEACPQLSNDYLRLCGETFAQSWKNHINQCLDRDIYGNQAEEPRAGLIY